jgi:hypothetical protein
MMTLTMLLICAVLFALSIWVHPYIICVFALAFFIGLPAAIMTDLTTPDHDCSNYYDGYVCE